MKKITLQSCFLFVLTMGIQLITAQEKNIFEYNDFQFNTNSGFTAFVTNNPGSISEGTLIKRTSNLPTDEADSPNNSILGYTRPANNIGHFTDTRVSKSIKMSGNSSTANFEGVSWVVTQAVDITPYLNTTVTFGIQNQYHEGADDDPFQILIAFDYIDGTDPSTVTWTDVTADVLSLNGTFGNDGNWALAGLDLSSYITNSGADKFAIAFKYTYHDDGNSFSGTDNRNGNWNVSDVRYYFDGYIETLENYTTANNTFTTETYIGDNGFSWTLDGKTTTNRMGPTKELYMQLDKTGIQSGTIQGGISSFSVSCIDIFAPGSTRNLELLVNGVVKGTLSHTGAEQYTFKVEDINVSGDITIALRNTDTSVSSVAFDNLMWTTYSNVLSSTDNISKDNITVFPNPTNSFINIASKNSITATTLFDFTGKVILTSSEKRIDVSSLPKGVYILKISASNGSTSTQKFIIN